MRERLPRRRAPRRAQLLFSLCISSLVLAGCGGETADQLYARAQQYENKGQHQAAIIELKNALQAEPDRAPARLLLGQVYLRTGQAAAAEKELRRALQAGASAATVLPLLAQSLLDQGRPRAVLEEFASVGLDDDSLLRVRGDSSLATGQLQQAHRFYTRVLAKFPGDAAALVGLARHSLATGDTAAAQRHADAAVLRQPANGAAWLFKGQLARHLGDTAGAVAAARRAVALAPDNIPAHVLLAQLLIAQNRFDEAKAALDGAGKAGQGSIAVVYTRGVLAMAQQRYQEALDASRQVLKGVPDYWPAVLLAGTAHAALGSVPQAEEQLRRYLDKYPRNDAVRNLLARTLLQGSRPQEALAALKSAASQADAQALFIAGESRLALGDYASATRDLEQAVELAPGLAPARSALGLSRLAQGQVSDGLADLEAAAGRDGTARAALVLAASSLRLGDYDKVLATTAAIQAKQPDNLLSWQLAGAARLAKGDVAGARGAFTRAATIDPAFLPAVLGLVQVADRDGQPEVARRQLEAFAKAQPRQVGVLHALANQAQAQGRALDALRWLEQANGIDDVSPLSAILLGRHYLQGKQARLAEKAVTVLRQARIAHPASAELLDALGQAQLAAGRDADALETYDQLAAALPGDPRPYVALARAQAGVGNDAAAERALQQAVAIRPDYLPANEDLLALADRLQHPALAEQVLTRLQKQPANAAVGHARAAQRLEQAGRTDAALAAYERALKGADEPGLAVKRDQLLRQLGRHGQADMALKAWQHAHPDDSTVALYAAQLPNASNARLLAIAQLEAILKKAPENPVVLNNLAWAYQQQGDRRALATAQQAYRLNASPPIADTLGWILVTAGRTGEGIDLLQKAVAGAPAESEFRYHLGYALNQSGQRENARKHLQIAVSSGKTFKEVNVARALLKGLE
ncbi:XrtA/PEP-CTERM system TPR-repeat protein PrsT [Pseudoduganella buxea]|uniref:Lipoprotein n=1 Tax=Pseudoduganella buxea TaxID=1949069 RepID=A0A6I3T8A5_9BURK|nr:XrtA/PEP-CTERM system TPR-repeat protein PrsT [Pseudoduganella buxea]MTV55827.1 PEP-CTERM system TPR-repeat protein PrsT [Pseudoduganella buxea]GGC17084.1 lipoprotein [Pseudoduganella buxea]